jgi:hypothetical protein
MPIFSPPIEIWLLHTEQALKQQLDAGDKPFLGLYADLFTQTERVRLRTTLASLRDPFQGFLNALQRWPAVFASHLTAHVVEGYGAQGNAAVYPYVAAALFGEARGFTPAEREKLWQAYRRACIRLGLDVIPAHSAANFMVAEYLHQAGVPILFAPDLAKRMLKYAAAAGVPDAEDPEAVALWQDALAERLGPPVPLTVARAVRGDINGFYVQIFLRLLEGADSVPSGTDSGIAAVMADALAGHGPMRTQGLAIPKAVWRDEWLGIELPPGDGIRWAIEVDGQTHTYTGATDTRFIPFDCPPLPGNAKVSRGDGALSKAFSLWDDGRNNRFLAFDSAGLLCAGGRLNAEEPLLIDPGTVTLVTRFRPDGYPGEVTEISPDPTLYWLAADLAPGETLTLRRGPAEARLTARGRPTLAIHGASFRGVGGNEFYASAGLSLRGQVPQELLTDAVGGLTLILTAPGIGPELEIPVTPGADGRFEVDLEAVTQGFRPALTRLGVELRRTGIRRPMARLAAYLWYGLQCINDRVRFRCAVLPSNLDPDRCDNLAVDETRQEISYRSDAKRFFRLAFTLESGRSVQFAGAVPGAFMMLKRFHEGQVDETPVHKGAVLAVRGNSMEVLDIYSSLGGTLTLGRWQQEIPPGPGMRRLHLSSLAEYLEPGQNRLWFQLPGSTPEALLGLVTPHQVLGMTTDTQGGRLRVTLSLPTTAEAMRCSAQDLLTGRALELDLLCNDAAARLDRSTLAWLSCGERRETGQFPHCLEVPLERWSGGAWLLRVEVRLQGRWGALVNEREDVYAWGVLIDHTGAPATQQWLLDQANALGPAELITVFKRVHKALLACYALDAWRGIMWLETLWRRLTPGLQPTSGQALTEVVALDALGPPLTAQASWFPLLSPGAAMPWCYARESGAYRGLGGRGGLLGELCRLRVPLCKLFLEQHIEQTLAIGFDNVMRMQQGTPPRGFSLKRYRSALAARNIDDAWSRLRREDWRPTEGDYLGPVHWRYALGAIQRRYRATLTGNAARRGWAMHLVHATRDRSLAGFAPGLPAHLNDIKGLGLMMAKPAGGWNQEQQNLLAIDRMLCLFAAVCRWESRFPGALDAWRKSLRKALLPDPDAQTQAVGYLLYVGRDVFEFYLLLWELVFAADVDAAIEESINV